MHSNRFSGLIAWITAAAMLTLLAGRTQSQPSGENIRAATGMTLDKVLGYADIHAFTWDEHGVLWILSGAGRRLGVSTRPRERSGRVELAGSFERQGNRPGSILVGAGRIYISDGDTIRVFRRGENKRWREEAKLALPPDLFPSGSQIMSIQWSPLGPIYFRYHSGSMGESGLGRVNLKTNRWDIVAKGIAGDFAFDAAGFPMALDDGSGLVFRVASGMDYERGLHNYSKRDLGIRVEGSAIKPGVLANYSGPLWPGERHGWWLIRTDTAGSTLRQFKEHDGTLQHQEHLVQWSDEIRVLDLQAGPEGAVWILTGPSDQAKGKMRKQSALYRLFREDSDGGQMTGSVSTLTTTEVINEFKNDNSWRRATALRVLEQRDDLLQTRGLHPNTGLHRMLSDRATTPLARVYGFLALHRARLLDDTWLENAADDKDARVRAWSALLFGERNYPTMTAFERLEKMAKDTNLIVRAAVAVAARQFVSGSLAVDTAPRTIPIREVFTGGILSGLWFSTEKGSTPEFDLLYWNAVRPISAFDAAHPLGFLNLGKDRGPKIGYWLIGLITQQAAEMEDPLKQEDAMRMIGKLNPNNVPLVIGALEGLKRGSVRRRAMATEESLRVLETFAKDENCLIAALGKSILEEWKKPFR